MVFLPSYLMPIYGIHLDLAGTIMEQWSGALLCGIGIICWYSAVLGKSALRDAVLTGLFIADTIAFVITLMGQLAGLGNSLCWTVVGLWFVLALGLGYFRFIGKD